MKGEREDMTREKKGGEKKICKRLKVESKKGNEIRRNKRREKKRGYDMKFKEKRWKVSSKSKDGRV